MSKQPTFWDVVLSRRTIRWFKDEPVPDEDLKDILKAGLRAPTASAGEQWLFVVIKDEEIRRKVYDIIRRGQTIYLTRMRRFPASPEELEKWKEWWVKGIYYAPVYIAGFMDFSRRTLNDGYMRVEWEHAYQSVTLALGYMMLAANAKGYGCTWISAPQLFEEEFKQLLGVPETCSFTAMLAIGKPAESPELRPRRPLEEVVKTI